jgi:hypothetical protein
MKNRDPQKMYQHLLVFILSLATPLVLYLSRHLDDNRLTSWNWVFNVVSPSRFLVVLIAVLLLAWLLSRASFYEKGKPFVLFVTSFVMATAFWSEPEVIVDAARYFTQAKHLKVYGLGYFAEQWGKSIFAWTDLPLVPFLYGLVFKFFGEHRVLIQALNTIFYSLTVVLTYQLGKTLWDEETGFWGGILLVDVPTMFFFMLAVVTCVYALKKGGANRIVLASFSLFLVFYVKYSSWMLLTVIPVIYAYFLFKNPVQAARRGGVLALLSLVFIGILFVLYKDIFMDLSGGVPETRPEKLERELCFHIFVPGPSLYNRCCTFFIYHGSHKKGLQVYNCLLSASAVFVHAGEKNSLYTADFPHACPYGSLWHGCYSKQSVKKTYYIFCCGHLLCGGFYWISPFVEKPGGAESSEIRQVFKHAFCCKF